MAGDSMLLMIGRQQNGVECIAHKTADCSEGRGGNFIQLLNVIKNLNEKLKKVKDCLTILL